MVEIKNITEKEEEKIKTRREKIAGYYLDISKLSFATTVLGGLGPMLKSVSRPDFAYVVIGVIVTIVFGRIGNNIF